MIAPASAAAMTPAAAARLLMAGNGTQAGEFATLDMPVLVDVGVVTAVFSVLGSIFVIACYIIFKRLRNFAFSLVLWLAVCDLMFSIANVMGSPPDGSGLCFIQAYLVSFFALAAVLWTTVIAYTLHISLHSPDKGLGVHKKKRTFHIYVWGLSSLLTLAPFLSNSYGKAGSFCWIRGADTTTAETGKASIHDMWRFVQFYFPLWLAMIYNTYVYVQARRVVSRMLAVQRAVGRTRARRVPLLMYPAVLLLCWAFGTINRIQNWVSPGYPVQWLFLAQVVTSNLQGALHALAYSMTARVRGELSLACCRNSASAAAVVRETEAQDRATEMAELSAKSGRGSTAAQQNEGDGGMGSGQVELLGSDSLREPEAVGSSSSGAGRGGEDDSEQLLAGAGSPMAPRRRRSSIAEEVTQLKNVSYQVRTAYYASLGMYALMGLSDVNQADLDTATMDTPMRTAAPKDEQRKATVSQTYFTLLKSFVGIGILAMPHAYMQAGYIGASIGVILIGWITYVCMIMLVECKQTVERADPTAVVTFASVGRAASGKFGAYIVDICIVITQTGFCTSYVIFIGESLADALSLQAGILPSWGRQQYIAVICVVLLPLVLLRSLKKLAIGALIADAAVLFGLVTIFIFDVKAVTQTQPQLEMVRPSTYPLFFGVAVFAFEGIGLVIPVQNAMAEPEKFQEVLRNSMIGYVTLLVVTATMSYAAWGDATDAIITLNLPKNGLTAAVQVFYAIGLYLTFPIVLFPVLQIMEGSRCYEKITSRCSGSLLASCAARTALMVGVMLMALLVPHFGLFVNLVGAGACSAIAFVLPTIFHLRLHKPVQRCLAFTKAAAIIVFGVVGGVVALILTVQELIQTVHAEANGAADPE